jgi:hypothetical protein
MNIKNKEAPYPKARLIAFYLPQFHPIQDNDEWWWKGYTEWDAVSSAKPLFKGHQQPCLPGELGFYDLRVQETREAQAQMARKHGIEAFCYWHYWFAGGKRIMEKPFEAVLASGEPDFPFCLAWANHSWYRKEEGKPDTLLIEQTYPGMEEHKEHFDFLSKAFHDPRYFKVNGKPLFYIFRPLDIPDAPKVIELWRSLAEKSGLAGLFLVGENLSQEKAEFCGLDAISYAFHREIGNHLPQNNLKRRIGAYFRAWKKQPEIYEYSDAMQLFIRPQAGKLPEYPSIIPRWDSTPRLGCRGLVLKNATPRLVAHHIKEALEHVSDYPSQEKILFVKSWNEWSEGNHLEPDKIHGDIYLKTLKNAVCSDSKRIEAFKLPNTPKGESRLKRFLNWRLWTDQKTKSRPYPILKREFKLIKKNKEANKKINEHIQTIGEVRSENRCLRENIARLIEAHTARVLRNLQKKNISRIAIFGAGFHTKWLLDLMTREKAPEVKIILDDNPQTKEINGVAVFKTNETDLKNLDVDVILLSSDVHQELFLKRCRELFGNKKTFIDLYSEIEFPGPYPKIVNEKLK